MFPFIRIFLDFYDGDIYLLHQKIQEGGNEDKRFNIFNWPILIKTDRLRKSLNTFLRA